MTFSLSKAASDEVIDLIETHTHHDTALRDETHRQPVRPLYRNAVDRRVMVDMWFDGIVSDGKDSRERYAELVDMRIDTIVTSHPTSAVMLHRELWLIDELETLS